MPVKPSSDINPFLLFYCIHVVFNRIACAYVIMFFAVKTVMKKIRSYLILNHTQHEYISLIC